MIVSDSVTIDGEAVCSWCALCDRWIFHESRHACEQSPDLLHSRERDVALKVTMIRLRNGQRKPPP